MVVVYVIVEKKFSEIISFPNNVKLKVKFGLIVTAMFTVEFTHWHALVFIQTPTIKQTLKRMNVNKQEQENNKKLWEVNDGLEFEYYEFYWSTYHQTLD